MKRGFDPLYVELRTEGGEKIRKKKQQDALHMPGGQTNACAKPDVNLTCCDCDERMVTEEEA